MNLDATRTQDLLTSALWIIRSSGIPHSHTVFGALIPIVRDVFPDGWEEWSRNLSPKPNQTMPTSTINHSIEEALDAARSGKRISNQELANQGGFIFLQFPSTVPEPIVPKMSSLPNDVKAEFTRRGGSISYNHQWGLVWPDNRIQGFMPVSNPATDGTWIIYHEDEPADFTAAPVSETAGTAKPL